jgi:hypothetical protein
LPLADVILWSNVEEEKSISREVTKDDLLKLMACVWISNKYPALCTRLFGKLYVRGQ